jgi:hypothetical protein
MDLCLAVVGATVLTWAIGRGAGGVDVELLRRRKGVLTTAGVYLLLRERASRSCSALTLLSYAVNCSSSRLAA